MTLYYYAKLVVELKETNKELSYGVHIETKEHFEIPI